MFVVMSVVQNTFHPEILIGGMIHPNTTFQTFILSVLLVIAVTPPETSLTFQCFMRFTNNSFHGEKE